METSLQIQNLKCGGCENTIINKLSNLNDITEVFVNHKGTSVTFKYTSQDSLDIVKKILSKLGYPVLDEKNHLGKKVTSYISCVIGKMHHKN